MELVLGTAQLRRAYGVVNRRQSAPDVADAGQLLAAAVRLGLTAVDTAPAYGEAEATIGASPVNWHIHTKIDPRVAPAASLAGSLTRLRRERVDVLYLHESSAVLEPDGELVAAASTLVGHRVGKLGASIYELEEFDAALADSRIGALQVPLNLLDRRIDADRLTAAAERGVAVYARSVLLQGVLAALPQTLPGAVAHLRPHVEVLHALARKLGRDVLELIVGWVRAMPGLHGMVIGADSVEDLTQTVKAYRAAALSPRELDAIREIAVPSAGMCDPRRWMPQLL